MAQELVLKAESRESVGSKHAQKLREKGKIPAVVYGHGEEPVCISLDTHDFVEGLHHGHRVMDIETPDGKETVMVKDLQYDYLSRFVIHADLIRVDVTERVSVEVPIELKGEPKGTEEEGGILEPQADTLEIECVVTSIPESLPVSVKEMELGDSLAARDVPLPEGVKLVTDPELLIAVCRFVEEEKTTEELEEEMPEAPEVIGEEKEEEEAEQPEKEQPEQKEEKPEEE